MLSVEALDLRVLYERNLRTLTKTQRYIEMHRAARTPSRRRHAVEQARKCVKELVSANREIAGMLKTILVGFDDA